jgi:hypothetical protein
VNTRFFVTDGPLATTMSTASESYFRENLAAGAGGVRVTLRDGSTDLITGSRYLAPGTAIRAEVTAGQLHIIYLGEVLKEYDDWADYTEITTADYPLGV